MHAIFFEPPIEANYLGHQFSEIYQDNIYLPLVQGKRDLTIIDVGANIGLVSYFFHNYAKIVYALEPSIEHFRVLTKMLEFNRIENVMAVKQAIYIKNENFPLFHNRNRTMYSLHTSVDDKTSPSEVVQAVTLESFFDEHKIKNCDILKLDVEGSEVEILSHSSFREVSPKIQSLIVETHDWSGRHPNQAREALKSNGFEISVPQTSANLLIGRR